MIKTLLYSILVFLAGCGEVREPRVDTPKARAAMQDYNNNLDHIRDTVNKIIIGYAEQGKSGTQRIEYTDKTDIKSIIIFLRATRGSENVCRCSWNYIILISPQTKKTIAWPHGNEIKWIYNGQPYELSINNKMLKEFLFKRDASIL